MSMYGRTAWTAPAGIGTFRKTVVCFTGLHAYMFGGAIAVGGIFGGAALGGIIGFIIGFSAVPSPEGLSRTLAGAAAAKVGATIGAILGALFAAVNLIGGKCTCPGWFNYGFCICIIWYQPNAWFPFIPILALPCPGECAILVPPGCP